MAERNSEYQRIDADHYCTPAWVTEALLSVETFPEPIWEPACGANHMLEVFWAKGLQAGGSDLHTNVDFLKAEARGEQSIITNPPYSLADKFVGHAVNLMKPCGGKVAMLLPIAWDAAKGRQWLFQCPAFARKLTLTHRIRWANLEQKKAGPSMNHAWFVWDWKHSGPPTMGWLP